MLAHVAKLGIHFVLAAALLHGATICTLPPPKVGASDQALALAAGVLRATDALYASRVGFAGITPPEVLSWRLIARSPEADSVFENLLVTGSRPARLYGMAWFHRRQPAVYQTMAARERAEGGSVVTMSGCEVERRSIITVLDEMNRGDWTRDLSTAEGGRLP
jgi:hypothetical protein